MFRARCVCGNPIEITDKPTACPKCRTEHRLLCPQGVSPDVGLLIKKINDPKMAVVWIGGASEIPIGKLPDNPICLPGAKVSRRHAKLIRDASGWKIVDLKSTNGLFVNKNRVAEHLLAINDVAYVGEYAFKCLPAIDQEEIVELPDPDSAPEIVDLPDPDAEPQEVDLPDPDEDYELAPEPAAATPRLAPVHSGGGGSQVLDYGEGPVCPSCERSLGHNAKVCVQCGIRVPSGRPLITSQGVDEDTLYENTQNILAVVSFLVPFSPIPTPLVSEAYGSYKPWTNRIFAAITILTSILFIFYTFNDDSASANRFMLWPKNTATQTENQNSEFQNIVNLILNAYHDTSNKNPQIEFIRDEIRDNISQLRGTVPPDQLERKAVEKLVRDNPQQFLEPQRQTFDYQPYQLLTSAFIHDNSHPLNFIMHLGGNLVFMFVFGNRVNALLGNILTPIIYPILAVCSALAFQFFGHANVPLLGASGAIFGLAGMYFILFPANRVHCAVWIWPRWLYGRTLFRWVKIFKLRGFWFLFFYFAYNVLMAFLDSESNQGGVAYVGHIGGFVAGVVIALGILASRQINCGGGDILSVALGKYAWPLIGSPAKRNTD